MSDYLYRATPADLELRGDGRTVHGLAVPYDDPTEIQDASGSYTETFRHGAFARSISERGKSIKLLINHQRLSLPIGRATKLTEDRAGLLGEFRVSQTAAGDEALELVRDGVVDAFSIAFEPIRDQWSRDRSSVDRLEARLREVSVVAFPAYAGAAIAGVRHQVSPLSPELARQRLELLSRKF